MENFCTQGGPFAKISDVYVAAFFKFQELTLNQSNNIKGVELPIDMGVTPELEVKILEKSDDVISILQPIREEEPDLLEK